MTEPIPSRLYDCSGIDLWGNAVPLKEFVGRPLLIVNTASLCGFSGQFKGLEKLWQRYRDNGLVVIGVPSNDFGKQEPGTTTQIIAACTTKFGVSFPLLQKVSVTGPDAHPLFRWLEKEGGFWARPRWNFYKYVIGRDGHLKAWFTPLTAVGRRLERAVVRVVQEEKKT